MSTEVVAEFRKQSPKVTERKKKLYESRISLYLAELEFSQTHITRRRFSFSTKKYEFTEVSDEHKSWGSFQLSSRHHFSALRLSIIDMGGESWENRLLWLPI